MAQITQLSPTATPGKPQSFSPKGEVGVKGAGRFTELGVSGVPGQRHSFAAKGAAPSKGLGRFTHLSPTGTPGHRYAFAAKAPTIVEVELPRFGRFKPLPVPQEFRHEGEVWTLVEAGAEVRFTPAKGSFSFRSRVSMRAGAYSRSRFGESEDRKRILQDDEDILLLEGL